MQATDINSNKDLLKALLDKSLLDTVDFISEKCRSLSARPEEPDFIAGLTLIFSVDLFTILKNLFSKQRFSVTAVYCHQKPLADIGRDKNPELGDLLLVYIYTDKGGEKHYNSLLLQAKITSSEVTPVSRRDLHQFELYRRWPLFTYARAGVLNGEPRDILPKTINDGAQYLLIDDDPVYGLSGLPGTFPMGCAVPANPLALDNDFTVELIDFLKFKSGRAFEDGAGTADDWTKMIWDLLALSKTCASKRKNSGMTGFPRQVTREADGYCVYFVNTDSVFGDLHKALEGGGRRSGDGDFNVEINPGVPVILIECSEVNEE